MKIRILKFFLTSSNVFYLLTQQATAMVDPDEGEKSSNRVTLAAPQTERNIAETPEEKTILAVLSAWYGINDETTSNTFQGVISLLKDFPALSPKILERIIQTTELCHFDPLRKKLTRINTLVDRIREEQEQR